MSVLKKILYKSLFVSLLVFGVFILAAQSPPTREYQLKAAFLFHFTQFVEWSESAYPAPDSPLVIGVLGEDPFGTYLDEIIAGEAVNGHPLVVRRFDNVNEVKECHILFIDEAKATTLEDIFETLEGRSILTVSDADNFIEKGGIIRFITVDKKIRFQINPDAAKTAKLKISSKLLSLAEIVDTTKNNN